MHQKASSRRLHFFAEGVGGLQGAWLAACCCAILVGLTGSPAWGKNPDFIIDSWQDHEGLPESSALALAQTPDGYLWVGSPEGLLRFDGFDFTRAEELTDLVRLTGTVAFLQTDRSGRLWAAGEGRIACYDHGHWRGIGGTNIAIRSVAESSTGRILMGGTEGQLYSVVDRNVEPVPPPDGVTPSGVFCITDKKDGKVWLANRGFIGQFTSTGWRRLGPPNPIAKAVLAAPAQAGGLWVYTPGDLWRYQADGTITRYAAPDLDQPREMMEDSSGTIWVATITGGLVRFSPGGAEATIDASNGLSHNAVRCILEDKEGNLWAGGSFIGLNRLKPRQFVTIGREEGLSDNAVRTVVEMPPGQILVGTHGGGINRIRDGKVAPERHTPADSVGQFIWSLVGDRKGRLWIGTYNDGLLVEEKGVRRAFRLPAALGKSISRLMEDSHGRIWVGGPNGLGIISPDLKVTVLTNSTVAGFAITSLAEDTKSGTIWIGTYAHGVFQLDRENFAQATALAGLPGRRISSLTVDDDGCVWIGIYGQGLACVRDGKVTLVGAAQGLPVETVGSLLNDGHGSFWMGTTRGILRVARAELHRLVQSSSPPAVCQLFNVSDGLGSEYCVEGYQPNSLRDAAGHLWFGTDRGVVTVNPMQLRLNKNFPPVVIERVSFTDRYGTNHVIQPPPAERLLIPPGSSDLEFDLTALCYTAPEKASFKYQLAGASKNWINLGNHRELHFRALGPGDYALHVTAANNDGVWNETGTVLPFIVQSFLWQKYWFWLVAMLALASGGGFAVWRVTRQRFQRRIEQLQHQRRLEQERARLATVMENTSDLVVFADHQGGLLHINPAGRKLIGLSPDEPLHGLKLGDLQPRWAADAVAQEGIPAASQRGTWESESALRLRDGREVPVSLVLIVHPDAQGQGSFISAIARDISARKRAEEAHRLISRRLGLIAQMTEQVLGNRTAAEVAQRLASQVMEVFQVDACVIRLLEDNRLVLLGSCGVPPDQLPPSLPVFGLAEIILKSRAPAIIPDVSQHPLTKNIPNPAPGGFAFRAFAGVPLEVVGEAVGLLGIYVVRGPREFLPVDTEHLQIVANHVAISLANDRHFTSMRSKNEQLEKLIAERQHAEAELQRRENYFRSLIEHASDSITVVNAQAVVVFQSSSGERILGRSAETILGRSLIEFVHAEDVPKAKAGLDQSLAQPDVPVTLNARLKHHNGSWRTIEMVGTSVKTETGEAQIILNCRDLTDNLKLEEQFRQAQKMEAIGQLAGGVAHDFNNILSSLMMQTELVGMMSQLPPAARDGLQQILADTRRAADLTRQLLLVSRRQVMQSRTLDLNEVVMNLAKMLQRIIREDVRLQLHLHPTPLMTYADAGMLDQVLMNLAVNARDAMPQGGHLRIETTENTVDAEAARLNPEAAPGRYVCFSVSDTGSGIPPEILPRIFEPFFTTKDAGKGTGLGLATVFGIVKQHRGWIKLDNRPGQGLTFQVFLPASTAEAAAQKPAVKSRPPGGTETILLVEDEPAVRKPTRRILEWHGYKVLEAADGLEALKLWPASRSAVALLLTDLVMPGGLGGQELGRRLAADKPGLKILFASGYSAEIAGRDFHLRAGEAFIQKPFVTDQLLELIRRCLDS